MGPLRRCSLSITRTCSCGNDILAVAERQPARATAVPAVHEPPVPVALRMDQRGKGTNHVLHELHLQQRTEAVAVAPGNPMRVDQMDA